MADTPTAAWYPDPLRRHQLRYWDSVRWTDHVSDNGVTSLDSLEGAVAGGQDVFCQSVLVFHQKAKMVEVANEYEVFDAQGAAIAVVTEVGQSLAKKALRVASRFDQFMTHVLEMRDMSGQLLLRVTRPRKLMRSTVVVSDAAGREIGRVVQSNALGKVHFSLESAGAVVGSLRAENWPTWSFVIADHAGAEVARITKTYEGLAKSWFTTADNYVVRVTASVPDPLRSMVVASALTIDTALNQDDR